MEGRRVALVALGVDLVDDEQDRHRRRGGAAREHRRPPRPDPSGRRRPASTTSASRGRPLGLVARPSASIPRAPCDEPARVDEPERSAPPGRLELDPVARHPRHLVRDRLAAPEQPVHEGRLPDVLAADHGDGGRALTGRAPRSGATSASATLERPRPASSSVVSSTIASAAGTSGFVARVSRSRVGERPGDRAGDDLSRSSARRADPFGLRAASQEDLERRRPATTTEPMSRPSITAPPCAQPSLLRCAGRRGPLGDVRPSETLDSTSADVRAASGGPPSISELGRSNARVEVEASSVARGVASAGAVVRRRRPRAGAARARARYISPVLRYGRSSAAASRRASVLFPTPPGRRSRSIGRHARSPRSARRAPRAPRTNPGKETSAASTPSTATGPSRRERRPRPAPSPSGGRRRRTRAPRQAATADDEVVTLDARRRPRAPGSRPRRPPSRSLSFTRSSPAPEEPRLAARVGGQHRQHRDLVDHAAEAPPRVDRRRRRARDRARPRASRPARRAPLRSTSTRCARPSVPSIRPGTRPASG